MFTRDMRRYSQGLYRVMGEIPTLITGPSGTGKELVARAIGYSQFLEFDSKRSQFVSDYSRSLHGLNLSAIPSELIELELFGYVKGAYTGATFTRAGFLDDSVRDRWDAVFLDEIGELDARISTIDFARTESPRYRLPNSWPNAPKTWETLSASSPGDSFLGRTTRSSD